VVAVDYREKASQLQELGAKLPEDSIIGLVDDYGASLSYYGWRYITFYPYSWDHDMVPWQGML